MVEIPRALEVSELWIVLVRNDDDPLKKSENNSIIKPMNLVPSKSVSELSCHRHSEACKRLRKYSQMCLLALFQM